jgi:hypothetical protein
LVERGPEKAGVGGSIPSLAKSISKEKGKSKDVFSTFAFFLFGFFSAASNA